MNPGNLSSCLLVALLPLLGFPAQASGQRLGSSDKTPGPGGLALRSQNGVLAVGGFSATRGGDLSFSVGSCFDLARSDLEAWRGPVTWHSSDDLTGEFLSGLDLVALSAARGDQGKIAPLSSSESTALYAYVLGGGNVLLFLDNTDFLGSGLATTFGVGESGYLAPTTLSTFVSLNVPVASGPAGIIENFLQAFAGYFSLVPPEALVLAHNSEGPSLIAFPEDALGPGSGRVVMYSDVQTFVDDGEIPYAMYSTHRGVFENTIHYILEGDGSCEAIVTHDVERCGGSGQLVIPVRARNTSDATVDLAVRCYVDGTFLELLKVYSAGPGDTYDLAFRMDCTDDQESTVLCELTGSLAGDSDSLLFSCSSVSSVSCLLSCCEQLFSGRVSTPASRSEPPGTPVNYDSITVRTIRGEGDRFFIRGSCTTGGDWIVDDQLSVNDSAYPGHQGDKGIGFPLGVPIELILNPMSATEVTSAIGWGSGLTTFWLADTGGDIYGNSDIYLIKTSSAPTGVWSPPNFHTMQILASPNPARSTLSVSIAGYEGPFDLLIVDILGRVVERTNNVRGPFIWDRNAESGSRIGPGLYLLVAESKGWKASTKFLLLD